MEDVSGLADKIQAEVAIACLVNSERNDLVILSAGEDVSLTVDFDKFGNVNIVQPNIMVAGQKLIARIANIVVVTRRLERQVPIGIQGSTAKLRHHRHQQEQTSDHCCW